jgi:hypothetical protein
MDHCWAVLSAKAESWQPFMSDRASEFLDYWEAEHVGAVPTSQRGQEAIRLAEMCRHDAVRAGIAIVDLQRAAKGNLVQNMLDALKEAANSSGFTESHL